MVRKRERFRPPKTGLFILAIDILILMGMFVFVHFYYKRAPISSHIYRGIEYRLIAGPLKGGIDYKIRLLMKNKGNEKKRLYFKVPMCEFIVKKGEEEVWRTMVGEEMEIVLEGGQGYELISIWNQEGKDGRIVEPGEYRVIAKINHPSPYSIATRIRLRE